jgi:hypothetical protein
MEVQRLVTWKKYCVKQMGVQEKVSNRWDYRKTTSTLVARGFEQTQGIDL